MKKYLYFIAICFLFLSSTLRADYYAIYDLEVQNYIDYIVRKYDFNRECMDQLFSTVIINEEIMTKVTKPLEAKPWYLYRDSFLTPERINKGVAYWNQHQASLALAEKKYGVPASIIVSIIGVETKYGENKGRFPVFNTLVNLAFNHNRRADFFRSELTEYLLLTRENQLKPLLLKGSYAGAVGLPQFMPSSYRRFAVDCYSKGFADLFDNDDDAIASVANYLHKHGWKTGTPVAILAEADCCNQSPLGDFKLKPHFTEKDLMEYGIKPVKPLGKNKCSIVNLEVENGYEYWLGLQNFYVISTYNKSSLYVMAVNLLAQNIREAKYSPKPKEELPVLEKPAMVSYECIDESHEYQSSANCN